MKLTRLAILSALVAGLLLLGLVTVVSATDPSITITGYAYTGPPLITADDATNVMPNSATLNGEVAYRGSSNVTCRGFEWGYETGNYIASWNETGAFEEGTFSHNISGLIGNVLVYWRAFAINTQGQGNSTELSFFTTALPEAPTNFVVTAVGDTIVGISWTMGDRADIIIIRGSSDGYPASVTDGYLVYSGNETSVTIDSLNLQTSVYYYRAWSYNDYGYSLDYAQTRIGGTTMMMIALLLLSLAFTGFYLWKREMWQGIVACLCWFVAAIFFMTQSAASNPIDSANGDIWLVLFWVCMMLTIAFGFAPFIWKRTPQEQWEEEEGEGGEPTMVQYVKGKLTGKTRDMTDLERRNREIRLAEEKANQSRPRTKKSGFAQRGDMQ